MSSSHGGSFGRTRLHVGTDWYVVCHTYPDTTPILNIDAGATGISVTPASRKLITAEAVAFARALARHAALFAADCERLHAEQHGQAHDEAQQVAGGAA